MVGEHLRKAYKLGQKISVRVVGADRLMRTIDFEIASEGEKEDGKDNRQDDCQ